MSNAGRDGNQNHGAGDGTGNDAPPIGGDGAGRSDLGSSDGSIDSRGSSIGNGDGNAVGTANGKSSPGKHGKGAPSFSDSGKRIGRPPGARTGSAKRKRAGSGTSHRAGSGSGSGKSGRTNDDKTSVLEDTPRQVNIDDLSGELKMPAIAAGLGAGWSFLFSMMQTLDPVTDEDGDPIWMIAKPEALLLGETTEQVLKKLPAGQRKAFAKFLADYVPYFALSKAVYDVAGPRIQYSLATKRAIKNAKYAVENEYGRSPGDATNSSATNASSRTNDGTSTPGNPPKSDSVASAFSTS